MDFQKTEYKRVVVLKTAGRIDSATAPELESALNEWIDTDKSIIFDAQDVDFISSAGWWTIIRAQKELKKSNRELILVGLCDNVRDSMDLIGILPYFTIYNTMVEAIGSI